MPRTEKPEKTCPNCSLLHARWGETCRERLMIEVRALRSEIDRLKAPRSTPPEAAPPVTETLCECGHPRRQHAPRQGAWTCYGAATPGIEFCACTDFRPAAPATTSEAPCGCTESYPQLVPGRVTHGRGCRSSGSGAKEVRNG